MAAPPTEQSERSHQTIRAFSDRSRQQHPGDIMSRGLGKKVALDRHREREAEELRDQWNMFLLEGREITTRYGEQLKASNAFC